MQSLDEFAEILTAHCPLAPLTSLGVGGPAEWLAVPRDVAELGRLVRRCHEAGIAYRILGGGTNVLVPDDGFAGVVIRIAAPAFQTNSVAGTTVTAGAGVPLADLIAGACRASLTGLEVLVGIPGSVGGALRRNAGGRTGDIGQFVQAVEVMDADGRIAKRYRSEIRFGFRESNLDDVIILSGTFELVHDSTEAIVRRLRKLWITKKSGQPFSFQASGYVFRNPRGLSASRFIEQAGLRGARVGGAELSDRDPKFIIAHPGATSRDVHRLIDLVRTKVEERTGVRLELQIDIW